MKQICLAIQNYHDVNNELPGHGCGGNGNCTAFVGILPFIEQQARYQAMFEYVGKDPNNEYQSPYNDRDCWKGVIEGLCCPSDANALGQGKTNLTAGNYCFNEADYLWSSYGKWGNQRSAFGMKIRTADHDPWKGSGWGAGAYNIASITDGTSNTVAISERVASADSKGSEFNRIKGGFANNVSPWSYVPNVCLSKRGANGQYATGVSTCGGANSNIFYYSNINAFFQTILPPNSPSCTADANGSGPAYLPPTSNHSGGVNAGFHDGSVRFISDTINCETSGTSGLSGWYVYWGVSQGNKSNFGVWGALGTMHAGETTSL